MFFLDPERHITVYPVVTNCKLTEECIYLATNEVNFTVFSQSTESKKY